MPFDLFSRKKTPENKQTEYTKESTPTPKYIPFQTPPIDCDKSAIPWAEKGLAVLKAQQQLDLKGFRGIEKEGKYRIIYFSGTSIKEAQDSFRDKINVLETFFGVTTPKKPKEKEEYWNKIIAGLEKA